MGILTSTKTCILFIITILLTHTIFNFCEPCLDFYIQEIFTKIQFLRTSMQRLIKLNIGEVFYIGFIIWMMYLLFKTMKGVKKYVSSKSKKDITIPLLKTLNSALFFYILIYLNWTVIYPYNKKNKPEPAHISINNDTLTGEQNMELLYNMMGRLSNDTVAQELNNERYNAIIREAYEKKFSTNLPYINTQESIFKSALAIMGISGYYHPITGESYINGEIHHRMQPFVIAHEMAHQLGVTSESAANFMAFWLCQNSKNEILQHSAYFNVMMQCLGTIHRQDSVQYAMIYQNMPLHLVEDIEEIKAYRKKSQSFISDYTMGFYNWFLKSNKNQGLKAYGQLRKDVYQYLYTDTLKQPEQILF